MQHTISFRALAACLGLALVCHTSTAYAYDPVVRFDPTSPLGGEPLNQGTLSHADDPTDYKDGDYKDGDYKDGDYKDVGMKIYDGGKGAACCSCGPTWTGRAGFVQLWRHDTSNVPIVGTDVLNVPIFRSSDFSFDSQSGMDLAVSWDNGCGRGFDVRYLGVNDFTAFSAFGSTNDPDILTFPRTDTTFDITDQFLTNYRSELQSFEALAHYCVGRINLTAGFRYIELNEGLAIQVDQPAFVNNDVFGFAAVNDLYGFQFGIDGLLWSRGRFRVDGFTKFGIYGNDTAAAAFWDSNVDPNDGFGAATGSATSFAMEVGVYANYDITCNLSLRGGYQMLYLDGVTLAADQVPNTGDLRGALGTTPVNVHSGNSLLYHGLNVGLEYRF